MAKKETKSPVVGADIEALCGKCGDVWHVVTAVVGGDVAKVQCKQCGAYHRYRPIGGKSKTKRTRAAGTKTKARKAAKAEPPPDGPTIRPDLSREIRSYALDETYEPADRIDHPKFGLGIVENIPGAGKMLVYFPEGRKLLAQARPPSKLEGLT